MLCAGLTMRLGFKLSDAFGSKWVLTIGIVVSTISTVIASTMNTFTSTLALRQTSSCFTTCCTG